MIHFYLTVADSLKRSINNIPLVEKMFNYKQADINQLLVKWGTNLLITLIIFVVGFWLAKMAAKTVTRVLRRSKTDEGLITFLTSLTSMTLKVLVIVTGINQLGIQATSFVAILGAAGLAVGMAFSGTLSNFAGGVMILAFKPFKVGDTIRAQNETGTVKEIQIFNTYLHTADNKVIILPNGPVANGVVTNFTKENSRRVDFVVSVGYGNNLLEVKELIEKFLNTDPRILKKPAYFVGVGDFGVGSVQMVVRAWVKTPDHAAVTLALSEWVYREFAAAGVKMPKSS